MPLPLFAIAAGANTLFKMFKGPHQNKLANKVNVPEANYTASPYAQKVLGQANMLLNSRMPGTANAENNIAANQGNAIGSTERNATSGAQALAMLGGIQGNTNNAENQLATEQGNWNMNTLNNWNNANQGMINEGDKVFQWDTLRKRQEAIAQKNALRGAATQNIGQGMNEATTLAYMLDGSGGIKRTTPGSILDNGLPMGNG